MTAPSLSAPWAPPHVLVVKSPEQKEELRWLLPNGEGVEWHSGCCVHRQCPDCLALGIKNYHCTKHRHHATTHRTLCDHPNCPCHSANHSTSDFFNSGSHLGVVVTMAADPLSISPSAPSTGGGSMGPHPAPWRHPFESTVTTAIPTTTTTTTTTSSSSDDRGLKPWRQGILVDARRGNPVASGSDSSNSKSRRVVATGRGGRPTASSAAPPSPPSTGGNVLVSPFLPSTAATTVSSPVVATTMIANTRSPLATRPPQSIVGTPHTEYCRPTSCPPSSSTQRRYHFAGDYASTNAAPGSGVHADGRSFTPPPRWTTTRTFAGVGGLVGSNGIRGPPHGGYVGQQPLGSVVVSATTSESLASGSPTNLTAQLHKQDHQRQLTAPTTMSSSNLHRPLQQFNLSYNQVLPVITGNSDPRYQYDKAPSTGHFQQVDPTMVRTTPMVVRESDDARPAFEMVPLPAVRRQYSEISMNGEISTTSRFGVVDSANVQQHDSQRHHSTSSSSIRRSVIRPSASPGVHSTPLFQAQDNISERVAAAGYSSSSQVPSISVRQMPSFGCYDDIGRAGSGPQVNPLAPSDFRNRSATVIRRNVAAADTASGRRQQVSTPVTTTRRTATATRGADGELYYHHNDCCDDGRSDFVGASHPVAVPTNASAIQGWESMNGSPSIMNEEGNRKTIKVSVGEGGSDGQLLGSLGCRSYDWVIESAAERCGLSEAEVLDLRNLLSDHYLRNTLALRKAVMYDRLPRGVSADVKEAFEFYLRQLAQSVHVRVLMHGSGGQTATGRSASQATKQSVSQYSRHEGQFSVSWTGTAGKGDGGEAAAARLDSDELSSSLTTTTGQQGEFHQATQTDYPASALSGVASSSVDSCGGESSAYLECEAPARTTKECDAQTSFRAEVVVVEREVLPSRMEVGATEGTAQTAAVDSYEVGAQTSDRSIAEGWTQTSHRAAIEGGMQATAITDEGGAQTVTVESGYDVAAQTSDRSVAEGWTQTSQRATTDGGTQTTNMLTEGAVQTAQAEMGSDAVAQTSARSVAEGYTQTSARAFVDRVAQTTAGSPKGMREYGAQTSARRVAEGATSVRGLVEFREKNTSPLHTFHHRDMKTSPGRGNYLIDAGTSPGRVGEYLMNRGVSPGRGEQFLVDAETSPRILSQPSVAAQTEIDFGAYLRSIRRRMLAVPQVGVQLRPRKPTLRKVTAAARVDIPSELDAVWDEIRRLEEELVESRTTVTASNMARAGMEDQLRASDAAKAEEIARLNAEGIAAAEAYRQLLEELEELRNLLSQSRTTKALSHVGGAWVDMQPSAAVTQQVEPRKLGLGTTIETASQVPAPHSLDKSPLLRCADSPPGDPPALTASHVLSTFVPPSIVRTPFDDLLDRKALEASPSIPPRRASTPRQFAPPSLSLVNTPEVEVRAGPPPSKSDRGGSESSSVSPAAAQLPKQRSVSGDAPRKASSRTYEGDLLHPRADAFQMALVVRGFDSTAQGNSLAKRHSDMSGGSGKVSQMLGTRTTPVAPPAKSQTELLRPRPTAFEMGLAARHMQGAYRGKQGGLNASVAASTASGFGWSTTAGASMLGDPSRTSSTRMRRQSRSFVQPPTKTGSGAAGESKLQKAATGEQSPPALSQMVSGANLHRLPSTDSESDADGLGGRGFQWRVEDSADRRHHLGHRGAVGADGTVDTSTPTESTAGFGEESVGSSPEKVSGMIGGSSALPPGDRRYTFGTGAQRRRQEDVDDSRDSNVPPVGRRDILESTGMYVAESGGGEKSSINENSSSLPNLVRGGSTVAVVTDSSNTADSVVGEVTAVEKKADGQDARWATTSSSQHQDGTTTVGTAVGGFDDRSSGGQDVTTVGTAEADERWGGDRDVETMRSTSGELRERTSGELHERSSAVLGSAVEFDDGARYLNEGSGLAENLDDDDDDDDEGLTLPPSPITLAPVGTADSGDRARWTEVSGDHQQATSTPYGVRLSSHQHHSAPNGAARGKLSQQTVLTANRRGYVGELSAEQRLAASLPRLPNTSGRVEEAHGSAATTTAATTGLSATVSGAGGSDDGGVGQDVELRVRGESTLSTVRRVGRQSSADGREVGVNYHADDDDGADGDGEDDDGHWATRTSRAEGAAGSGWADSRRSSHEVDVEEWGISPTITPATLVGSGYGGRHAVGGGRVLAEQVVDRGRLLTGTTSKMTNPSSEVDVSFGFSADERFSFEAAAAERMSAGVDQWAASSAMESLANSGTVGGGSRSFVALGSMDRSTTNEGGGGAERRQVTGSGGSYEGAPRRKQELTTSEGEEKSDAVMGGGEQQRGADYGSNSDYHDRRSLDQNNNRSGGQQPGGARDAQTGGLQRLDSRGKNIQHRGSAAASLRPGVSPSSRAVAGELLGKRPTAFEMALVTRGMSRQGREGDNPHNEGARRQGSGHAPAGGGGGGGAGRSANGIAMSPANSLLAPTGESRFSPVASSPSSSGPRNEVASLVAVSAFGSGVRKSPRGVGAGDATPGGGHPTIEEEEKQAEEEATWFREF